MSEFLYEEMTNEALEEYTKERCDEMRRMYDYIRMGVMDMLVEDDRLKRLEALVNVVRLIEEVSAEHIDTLDRYLYAYELCKRKDNKITKLEHPEVEFED